MAKGRKPLSDDQDNAFDKGWYFDRKAAVLRWMLASTVIKTDPNNIEAYEALEVEYERIFGQLRFSEYDSFRGSVTTKKSSGA